MLLEKYSVSTCLEKYGKITNVNDAIKQNAPSISQICKYVGDTATSGYIELFLIDLNHSVSVANPLSVVQINFISFTIVNRYRNLTLADITLIFSNAKTGVYGAFYENLSPDKVLTWFREYLELRMEACENKSLQQHQNFKESGAEPRNSEMTVKQFINDKKNNLL